MDHTPWGSKRKLLYIDWNEKMCGLFQKQFPDIPVIHGDLGDPQTLVSIWNCAKNAAVGFVGFACQPYSPLGDSRGVGDERSACLSHALAIAALLRFQVLIIECVQPALQNDFVRAEIQKFLHFTGFFMSCTELKLSDVWPTGRHRAWWVVSSGSVVAVVTFLKPHGS